MNVVEIDKRYSDLAESTCCLSCGGAVNHSDAKTDEICVDFGSGRGTDVLRLAEKVGENGFIFGIDISDGMIKKSVDTANRLGIKNVRFLKNTLEKTDLKSNFADLVISNCTINHSSDKQAVWNEIFRILKHGGRFIVSDIYAVESVPEEYKNDPVAVSECWAGSVTRNEYLQHLANAGFIDINILEKSVPYLKGKVEVISWTIRGVKS